MSLTDKIIRNNGVHLFGGKKRKNMDALREHPIFREIDSWIKVKCKTLDIRTPSKKAMAEKYLQLYFQESYIVYRELCADYDKYAAVPRTIYKTLHNIVNATNEKAVLAYIPSLFIDKMNARFFKHIDILSQSIAMSSSANLYSSDFEQILSILDMSLVFIQLEVDTIEDTINSMNGELEKLLKGTVYDK